jgi:hypothetical protein
LYREKDIENFFLLTDETSREFFFFLEISFGIASSEICAVKGCPSIKKKSVENHFADLNQFQILHHAYRGNILHHANALLCCEVFLSWTWKYYGAVLRLLAEKQCVNHLINIYLILQFFIFF